MYIGSPYLFLGFLPISLAAQGTVQGFKANGAQITFSNCDSNPNSYFAIFPNFAERVPSNYGTGWGRFNYAPVCSGLLAKAAVPPSHRDMPCEYFMFMEAHFGGCGCYAQNDDEEVNIQNAAIGFV